MMDWNIFALIERPNDRGDHVHQLKLLPFHIVGKQPLWARSVAAFLEGLTLNDGPGGAREIISHSPPLPLAEESLWAAPVCDILIT